jgi:hypothetical protein
VSVVRIGILTHARKVLSAHCGNSFPARKFR